MIAKRIRITKEFFTINPSTPFRTDSHIMVSTISGYLSRMRSSSQHSLAALSSSPLLALALTQSHIRLHESSSLRSNLPTTLLLSPALLERTSMLPGCSLVEEALSRVGWRARSMVRTVGSSFWLHLAVLNSGSMSLGETAITNQQ